MKSSVLWYDPALADFLHKYRSSPKWYGQKRPSLLEPAVTAHELLDGPKWCLM
jgi:hypothetical protein